MNSTRNFRTSVVKEVGVGGGGGGGGEYEYECEAGAGAEAGGVGWGLGVGIYSSKERVFSMYYFKPIPLF